MGGRETTPSESQVDPPGLAVSFQQGLPWAQHPGSQDWCLQERSSHNWKQPRHACELQPDCPSGLAKVMECLLEGGRSDWAQMWEERARGTRLTFHKHFSICLK